ncbi:MAG TPA: hypothetical protein VFS25_03400 [Chitinophaga sp.]|uniref:hypothetical protein n=1 Tax=Chitinophaga sp. TaxID=1869181 RepID=UPI002DB94A95|nr:hypothetical protein [Chitinophaga sp.]HEU4551847.1 hypothetical protein [Chitinophaga sp.]
MNTAAHSPQTPNAAAKASGAVLPAQEPVQPPMPGITYPSLSMSCQLTAGAPNDPLEHEADTLADTVMRMPETTFIQRKCAHCEAEEKAQRAPHADFIQKKAATVSSAPVSIQRFSDDDHHVIDESALSDVFDETAIHGIETGNKQRDYSQSPPLLNALLLGSYSKFGGYKDYEHFDNFVWDREKERWISRDEWDKIWDEKSQQWVPRTLPIKHGPLKKTPLEYIEAELLAAVEHTPPSQAGFVRMGNAFHTIEDFFAHSNFLELTQHDTSFGEELTTGSVGSQDNTSLYSIMSHVTSGTTSDFYQDKFIKDQAASSATSHAKIAKDYPSNKNHELAILLASLVIHETAVTLKSISSIQNKAEREKAVKDVVMERLKGYLRPPSEKDKWWERLLQGKGGEAMRGKVAENRRRTVVTENQSALSPLRALEANKYGDVRGFGGLQVLPELAYFLYKARSLNLLSLHLDDFPLPSISVPIGDEKFITFGKLYNFPGLGNITNPPLLHTSQFDLVRDVPPINQDKAVTPFIGISITGKTDFLSGR